MAKPADAAPQPKGGIPLMAILALTVIGGGAGGFFGMQIPKLMEPAGPPVAKHDTHAKADPAHKMDVRMLPAVTTNLGNPASTWIRIESAVVLKGETDPKLEALIGKIPEDLVAYLRTVPLSQIEGPSGFQHLREDLNDRVRVRSEGRVAELLIQALVIE